MKDRGIAFVVSWSFKACQFDGIAESKETNTDALIVDGGQLGVN